jgi:hypothetical protein
MQVQKLTPLNFEKIIIIILFLNLRHKKLRKNEFHKNRTMFWLPTTHSDIRMFFNGIKIQFE